MHEYGCCMSHIYSHADVVYFSRPVLYDYDNNLSKLYVARMDRHMHAHMKLSAL